ncbi:AraC family transcriptional regulator [Oleiagrimonas soli]|uniref:AraC family transcriptional regulator n=1 Tax=Oleiagrimonas soli TaxID=1543381 RepID=A0A099CZP8_9GAMM|nr:AraC family transcriptional regulator [Oleiagrimonas soli]
MVEAFRCSGRESPWYTAVDGLILLRAQAEQKQTHLVHKPALCIVVQGVKWTTFGAQRLAYRTGQAMVVSVEMPGASQVIEGGSDAPYLSVVIELDGAIMREVYARMDTPPPSVEGPAAFVMDLDRGLLDCAARAVRLLSEPEAIAMLYPTVMREICYRLLAGPHGAALARMVVGTERDRRVTHALQTLRERYTETIRVDELAGVAGLSPAAFHRKFKAMTGMTPVQFQKQMRLMEARRRMLSRAMSAEVAAYEVGYASPSQFSRDYARLFGAPPRRDIERLRRTGLDA